MACPRCNTLQLGLLWLILLLHPVLQVTSAPKDGVYIDGLYVDGAQWQRKSRSLADAEPGCMYSPLPVVHFSPRRDANTPASHYSCPLYKTSLRAGILSTTGQSTNFVLYVDLPVAQGTNQDYLILHGVALLCMLDT
jgi:dynein heavy chain, axonemal